MATTSPPGASTAPYASQAAITPGTTPPPPGPGAFERAGIAIGNFGDKYGSTLAGWSGAATGIGGALLQARALRHQGRADKAAAEYNAALAEAEGIYEHLRIRRMARQHLSSQYAQMNGKSGVIGEEGGWLSVIATNASAYERDAVHASISARATADLERWRGRAAEQSARAGSRGAILSGVAQGLGAISRIA
jgi:hypothetical protein